MIVSVPLDVLISSTKSATSGKINLYSTMVFDNHDYDGSGKGRAGTPESSL